MQIIEFFLGIVFVGFLVVVFVIDAFFDCIGKLIVSHPELIIPAIVLICGIIIVKRLAKKIREGESMKFYLSCYAGLLKNPYFYLVEIMALIAVWDKAWMLALLYGLAFPFIAANAIFLGNKLKK